MVRESIPLSISSANEDILGGVVSDITSNAFIEATAGALFSARSLI